MGSVSRRTALRIIGGNILLAILYVGLILLIMARHTTHRFDKLIELSATKYDVDPRLVWAVIWQESRFNPRSVGTKNEVGLMQIMEIAGREWADAAGRPHFRREDLFDPATNIEAGTWYLARAIERWSACDDPIPFALAEYNAGRSNALRWYAASGPDGRRFIECITYPTTRKYIESILRNFRDE
jgi:soluble lytic murein transglycosylase